MPIGRNFCIMFWFVDGFWRALFRASDWSELWLVTLRPCMRRWRSNNINYSHMCIVVSVYIIYTRNISVLCCTEYTVTSHTFSLSTPVTTTENRNTSLAAPGALAHRLQRCTACKIQNGRQGAHKWPPGSGRGSNPRLLAISSHFCK